MKWVFRVTILLLMALVGVLLYGRSVSKSGLKSEPELTLPEGFPVEKGVFCLVDTGRGKDDASVTLKGRYSSSSEFEAMPALFKALGLTDASLLPPESKNAEWEATYSAYVIFQDQIYESIYMNKIQPGKDKNWIKKLHRRIGRLDYTPGIGIDGWHFIVFALGSNKFWHGRDALVAAAIMYRHCEIENDLRWKKYRELMLPSEIMAEKAKKDFLNWDKNFVEKYDGR